MNDRRFTFYVANRWRNYFSCFGFIFLLIIYALNELYLKQNFTWCKDSLNDLLAMPLLLYYSKGLFLFKKKTMPKYLPWMLFIICSFIWEGIMPYFYNWSISDIFDVLMYLYGTIFWVLQDGLYDYLITINYLKVVDKNTIHVV